ncbi:MAG: hypothetical protein ABWK53_10865 [Anaerolineales bacterium]
MASISLTLSEDYWRNLQFGEKDLEFVSTYLFEHETPLTEKEILPVLLEERLRLEQEALRRRRQGNSKLYLPREHYRPGDGLVFPALDWKGGRVTAVRPGVNPALGEFEVIEVEFADGSRRQFAAGLETHALNAPPEAPQDEQQSLETILAQHEAELTRKLVAALEADPNLVRIAGRWFPRALLVDVNLGHLNLAEAVLDEAKGQPLPTSALLEQVELPADINPKLLEFSMNLALQEDERFDEVGPAGEVLWCLRRLEPPDVQQVPAFLRYLPLEYDTSLLTEEMRALEANLDDELSDIEPPANLPEEVTLSLSYPHWRAGTLPLSARMRGLFPTAYVTPRVRFTILDGVTNQEMPAWVVRQHGYVAGLGDLYRKHGLIPGSLITVRRSKKPGQVILEARVHRPMRDWVRTVLVGSDGGLVFATLKQNLTCEFNERMVIAVPDIEGVDQACARLTAEKPPFENLALGMLRELSKLNVQGHVHAQELYSAINIVRRCPPAPLFAWLAGRSDIKHVGDLHFRLTEAQEASDD